jgi:hypothetical protein
MAVMLSYPMLAPLTGVRAAITTTALLAASPAAVSQARRGWDPSATVLLSLLVSAFAMLNRPWLCGFSFLLSLAVHPTNVFLAPIAASQWGPTAVEWYRAASESQRRRMLRIAVIVLPFVAVGGFYVARTLAHAGFAPSIEIAIERLISLSAWQALGVGVVGLFSGITSAAIAGPPPFMLRLGASAIVFAAFTLAGVGSWLGGRERSALQMAWLSGGIVVSVLAFHVVAGPRALEPGVERYAMFLVVPLTIFCACGVNRLGRGANLTAAVLCSLLAAVLAFGYFVPLAMRGGDGYPMYRTGAVEPKLAAFEFLSMHSRDAEVVAIFADDWWLYWPLRYLAWHDRRMHVEVLGNYDSWPMPPGAKARPYPHPPDRVYAVVFSHGTQWARLRNEALQLFTATDPLGRPIVDVMTVPPDSYERLRDVMPWQSRQ